MGASRPLVAQMIPCLTKHYDKTSFYFDCIKYNIVQNHPISPPTHPMIKRFPKTINNIQ